MDIPTNLPTDNFYKFLTLLGLVMVAVSIYGMVQAYVDANTQIQGYYEEYRGAEPTTRQIERTNEVIEHRAKEALSIAAFLGRPLGIGIAISLSGLALWYFKHQVHLDRILKLEREKAEAEAAARKPTA